MSSRNALPLSANSPTQPHARSSGGGGGSPDWDKIKATAETRMALHDAEVEARWAKASAHAAKLNKAAGDE